MDLIKQTYHDAEPNLDIIGGLGLVCYPVFYYIGTYWVPQLYENLSFRLVLAVFGALLLIRRSLPGVIHKYFPYYYLFMTGLGLPFFFFYMLIMNGWSHFWAMSCMTSILIHILLVQRLTVLITQVVISVFAAYLAVFWKIGYEPFIVVDWTEVFFFISTYALCVTLFRQTRSSQESKVSIAKSFGAGIAHEMRNPMSALKTSVDVIKTLLPVSTDDADVTLSHHELDQIHTILDNSDRILYSANEAIDLLLTSIDKSRIEATTFKRCSADDVIKDTLLSYPYKESKDKHKVHLSIYHSFEYFGSDTLLKYTIYNLLKNAFYYNHSVDFSIHIELSRYGNYNVIRIRDNGIGIEEEKISQIFDDFYSSGKHDGFGLGLPFCRKVMESFGGKIRCESLVNQWTEFTLYFPQYESKVVRANKSDVIKTKHVLYIGERDRISGDLSLWSYAQHFNFTRMHLHRACHEKSTKFDVVIVDIEKAYFQLTDFLAFENNLHFAGAKICYLHDERSRAVYTLPNHVGARLITTQHWKRDGRALLDELIFDVNRSNRSVSTPASVRSKNKILIVDDNQSIRTITMILLQKAGYVVDQAKQGQEALDLMEQNQYDLLLLDVEMPVLDGLQLTHIIRDSNRPYNKVTIVGYTGDNSPSAISAIKRAGMNDYIVKPADKKDLLDKLEQWCS